jgi:hypothetical protein
MRYVQIETISFQTADGLVVSIKSMRPIPKKASSFTIVPCDAHVSLDEIASRTNIYGAGFEGESYQIFEENQTEIFEARFDMSKIKNLRVPI